MFSVTSERVLGDASWESADDCYHFGYLWSVLLCGVSMMVILPLEKTKWSAKLKNCSQKNFSAVITLKSLPKSFCLGVSMVFLSGSTLGGTLVEALFFWI